MAADPIRTAYLETRQRGAKPLAAIFGTEAEPHIGSRGGTGADQGARGYARPKRPIVDVMIRLAARRRR